MEREGPVSSVGRNFWAVWSYITGAISRFFRPEAINNFTNDSNSSQDAAVHNESAACGQMEKEASKKEVEADKPLTTLSVLSSPHPVVAWDLCGEPDAVDAQYKTQLTEDQDKASVRADEAREGEPAQSVDGELFNAEDSQGDGDRTLGLYTDGRGELQGNDDCVNNRLFDSNVDTGAEEAATRALIKGDRQRVDKTPIKGEAAEGEDDTMSREDKKNEKSTDEKRVQRDEDVLFLASINEGEANVAEQVISQFPVLKQNVEYRLQHENISEGEVAILGKHDDLSNLMGMESHDVKSEGSGVVSHGNLDVLRHTQCSVNDSLIHEIKTEKEKLSYQMQSKERYTEASCTSAPVAANFVNEAGRETSGEFKNIVQGTCEGQLVVSQGLNTPPCEEAQRGFPECNNERGQDENTTQTFLDERDPEESQSVLLPEETECIQNIRSSRASDRLLLMEHGDEEQKSKDDFQESFDLAGEDHSGFLHFTDAAEPQRTDTPLVESGNQEILFDFVRTGIKHPGEEPGVTTEELRGASEDLLVELRTNDACDVYLHEGDQEKQDVVEFTDEIVQFHEDAKQEMARTSIRSPSLLEDFSGVGLVREEVATESTFLEEKTAETQDAGMNTEKSGHKDDEMGANDESERKNEKQILNGAGAGMPGSFTDGGNSWVVESKTLVTPKQQTKATSNDPVSKSTAKDMTEISAAEVEKNVTVIYVEETSANNVQEMVDEETTDPPTQTLLSQDADGVRRQEGPEPGQRSHWEVSSLNISPDPTETEERFVEPCQSGASEFRSDAEMSSTERCTLLDDAPCGLGELKGESQLWTLNVTGSIQGMAANRSEPNDSEILIPGPTTESLDIVMEESVEEQHSHPGEVGILNQECVESQDDFSEESGSQSDVEITDYTGGTEKRVLEEDIQSSKQMDTLVQVTKVDEDTLPLYFTSRDGGEVEEETGSGSPRSPTEGSLGKESVSTEGGPQGVLESSRLLDGWSEDNVDAAAGLNRPRLQVSVLDSSPQKSRISVKNPRVRPPKDPRSLLHMPSLDPTPSPHPPAKLPVGFPAGGRGIGIKLPGLSGGLPVLKKTQPKIRDEVEPKPESKSDPAEDEQHRKPKWMPPRQPGFGNPLMSELKTKLKKTARENEL